MPASSDAHLHQMKEPRYHAQQVKRVPPNFPVQHRRKVPPYENPEQVEVLIDGPQKAGLR